MDRLERQDMTQLIKAAEARGLRYPFVAIPDESDTGGYTLVFPDLPGVSSWAPTLDAVPSHVLEVLDLEFEGAEADGFLVPAPSGYPADRMVRWGQPQEPARDPDVPVLTAAAAGEALGITAQAVNVLARKQNLGWILGRQRVFTAEQVEAMRDRPGPGQPRKVKIA
jgi:predicted RNase H-like HicB family nuclease